MPAPPRACPSTQQMEVAQHFAGSSRSKHCKKMGHYFLQTNMGSDSGMHQPEGRTIPSETCSLGLWFCPVGAGKEERRRRSVLAGDGGATIETWLRRNRIPACKNAPPNNLRDYAGLCAPSHHRRKPTTAARMVRDDLFPTACLLGPLSPPQATDFSSGVRRGR